MHLLSDFFHRLRDLRGLIEWGSYTVLAAIIFAETGLLVGFFLPGDSLLFTAGVLASTTKVVDIWYLNALLIPMAIIGDAVGYQIGKRAGPPLFSRKESLLFKPSHLLATKEFYDRHGGKTIIMARFMPLVRTFAPVVAGVAGMPYRKFVLYNVVGGVSWILSMTWLGYLLGNIVSPKRVEHIVYLIIVVSVLPVGIEYLKHRRRKAKGENEATPAA